MNNHTFAQLLNKTTNPRLSAARKPFEALTAVPPKTRKIYAHNNAPPQKKLFFYKGDTTMIEIHFNRRELPKLATKPEFLSLLVLGRIINSIRFAQQAAIDNQISQTPPQNRQMANSFFHLAAILFEACKWLRNNRNRFSKFSSWQNEIEPIFKDEIIKKFVTDNLPRLRDKFVFHFDDDFMKEGLKNFIPDGESITLATCVERADGLLYFDLSDILSFVYLLSDEPSPKFYENLKDFIDRVNTLSKRFVEATAHLIREIIDMNTEIKIKET